jgi:hypothetical protein
MSPEDVEIVEAMIRRKILPPRAPIQYLPPKVVCARATGDIHVGTFDNSRYDLQAVGEFVASEDLTGQTRIQLRLERWGNSSSVSVATAVAVTVDGASMAIHLKPKPQVYVNDRPAEIDRGKGLSLGTGGSVMFTGTSWVIAWSDGTEAWVTPNTTYFDLVVRPGSSAGKLKGLLGNADGKADGDLVGRDGSVLPSSPRHEDVHGRFADSWRIRQEESLFHYAAGESTVTFTDRTMPSRPMTVANLSAAARAAAERICKDAGITEPAAQR